MAAPAALDTHSNGNQKANHQQSRKCVAGNARRTVLTSKDLLLLIGYFNILCIPNAEIFQAKSHISNGRVGGNLREEEIGLVKDAGEKEWSKQNDAWRKISRAMRAWRRKVVVDMVMIG